MNEQPGRLNRALTRLLMNHAEVAASEALGRRLRLITLESPAFQGIAWAPGQYVQIAMGSAFRARAYTPLDWDGAAGRLRFIGVVHGNGPGSAWVEGARPGDECDVFGPRRSLDFRAIAGPLVVVGDETAIGLAYAAVHADPARPVTCHFEVDDVTDIGDALAALGLGGVTTLHPKRPGDGHLADLEAALTAEGTDATFVLSGKADTVDHLRKSLKRQGAKVLAKPYWAPGRKGMD